MKAAGGVLTAKQAPRRPGTAPAHGLRAERCSSHCTAGRPVRGAFPMSRRTRLSVEALEDRLTPSFTWGDYPSDLYPPGVAWGTQTWGTQPPLLADFTSDGILDQIYPDASRVAVRPGRGDGTFGDPIYTSDPTASCLAVADFNGD